MKNIKFAGQKQVITYLIVAITICLFGLTGGYIGFMGTAFAFEDVSLQLKMEDYVECAESTRYGRIGTIYGNDRPNHSGSDYACYEMNEPLKTVGYGMVRFRNDMPNNCNSVPPSSCPTGNPDHGLGNVLEIEHLLSTGEKIYSSYNHLNGFAENPDPIATDPLITRVAKKQIIGYVGASGQESLSYWETPHLHFEIKNWFGIADPNRETWGSTKGTPDDYGYRNPNNYLNKPDIKVLIPYFSNTNGNPTVNTKLTIDIPCIELFNKRYHVQLDSYINPNDSSSYYFKLNFNDFNEIFELTPSCGASIDENLNITCVKTVLFDGLQYTIDLERYDNPSDTGGFYWKLGKYKLLTSISNYDVYGTSGQPLYASMMLNPVQDTSFKLIGIGGRDKNDKVVNILEPRDNIFGPTSASTCFGKRTFLCKDAVGCDYKFFAYIDKRLDLDSKKWVYVGNGYPVKMTILPNAQSEIIDNDGYNVDAPTGNSNKAQPGYYVANEKTNTVSELNVAGYYLSAKLFKGGKDQWARWFPTNAGKYQIYVHIPSGANAKNVQYKISPQFVSANITSTVPTISDPINHSTEGWVQLKSGSGTNTNFTFKKGGHVSISVKDIPAETLIDDEQVDTLIGVDAVKFIYVKSDQSEPNLTLKAPRNYSSETIWSDTIVVSDIKGTTTDSPIFYKNHVFYIDFAPINDGTSRISTDFCITLFIDDVEYKKWFYTTNNSWFLANYYTQILDYSIGTLAPGKHQIKIKVDSTNFVSESNEIDNEFTKTITIVDI